MEKATASPAMSGSTLVLAGLVLAVSNFMVVLDTTIANVSVPHIAGGLGISSSEGTWVITSYAVAEAICVPLTGWLARRFGEVKVFIAGMVGFGLFSFLCGLAPTLGALVAFRVGQGLCGGPLMPISQTLLMRIFPKERHGMAMALWSMTTIVAPIFGPILGGTISDNWGWNWIFFINVPIAIVCSLAAVALLRGVESKTEKIPVDTVGLGLLVLAVGALQIMLDLGREHDWFGSSFIVQLALVAFVGFAFLIAWEVFDRHPIVDLKVFRHRGFTVSVTALAFTYGAFFASLVVIPQWLQTSLGYTATWAGYATAWNGVAAVFMAPVAAMLSQRMDPRILVSGGILWLAVTSLTRVIWWTSGSDFWTLAIPQLIQGAGMPFFFVPLTTLALGAVEENEVASAAGLMNFLRTMSGAIGTAIGVTMWENGGQSARDSLTSTLNGTQSTMATLQAHGFGVEQSRQYVSQLVDSQANAISTVNLFELFSAVFVAAAAIIWLAPKPKHAVAAGAGH
ncbi:MAG: DHA2 family efflux MFS transporter permease subunit [Sphingomonas sp.]|nr:DHA2 family efflux MFS transporter permease subunit [Sphingomonas sp.]MBW0006530.1 DHA2 family efflux MFS transporter permease subunit [Sphingomonas sp.]